jgi:hypothetical protein
MNANSELQPLILTDWSVHTHVAQPPSAVAFWAHD